METVTTAANEPPAKSVPIASESHGNAALREFRLVTPVVTVWFVIWLPLWVMQKSQSHSERLEYLMLTVCCVGIASTVLWCCLYGEFSLRRIGSGLLLLVSTTTAAMLMGKFLFNTQLNQEAQLIVGFFFVGLLAFVPGWILRRFLRWRICRFSELSFSHDNMFQIADVLRWTAGAAVLLALLPMFVEVLFSDRGTGKVGFVIFFVSITIVVPSVATLCYFTLLSTVRSRYASLLIPFLAAGIAMFMAVAFWCAAINGPVSFSEAVNEAFWQATTCFSLAGYFLLAVVSYLRMQGLHFKVGLVDHRSCARREKAKYEEYLQKKIRSYEASAVRSRLELEVMSRVNMDALA